MPLSRIRWDRASQAGLLGVLAIIAFLWISGIIGLIHSHAQAEQGLSQVHRLAVTNRQLRQLQHSLSQRATIIDQARSLGMVRSGQQSFIFDGNGQ